MTSAEARAEIQERHNKIELAKQEINDIAKQCIPDFHFLDYAVSNFWSNCEKSPIGWCVFTLDEFMRKESCRYCGGPVERK